MDKKVVFVLKGFTDLTQTQRQDLIKEINKFQEGGEYTRDNSHWLNQDKTMRIKINFVLLSTLVLMSCATSGVSPVNTGGFARYECYTYVDSNHVLTLPIPDANAENKTVQISFLGDRIPGTYQRNGLTQLWFLEDNLYIQVDPDFTASYMDFRGAEKGESRKPSSVFECKKRR